MLQQRTRMRVELRPVAVPVVEGMRHPTFADESALSLLMMQAYVGTVDYEGETDAEALDEIRQDPA